jgi:hypothetical protein
MAITTNTIQLPPDGVGKKVRHRLLNDLTVSVTTTPELNTLMYGASSGCYGNLIGSYNAPDGSVSWFINVTSTSVTQFVSGENLTSASLGAGTLYGTITALGSSGSPIYQPVLNISDAKVPEYTLSVDNKGAAYTRFQEGTPQFDAWGHMQVSQMQAAGEYYHFVQDLSTRYYTTSSGSGSVVHNPNTSSMVYTTTTAAGDLARRSTGQYHPYKPGVSQLIYTSLAITAGGGGGYFGGSLQTGKIAEWGYFDDNNGFGFRLNSDGYMYVFLRSDTSGVPVETVYRQDYWNVNTLTSATKSDFLLNWSLNNLWWMDVQGTIGRIRLGVETQDGRRITCHQFTPIESAGIVGPSCRNLSLPVTWQTSNYTQTVSNPNGGTVTLSNRTSSSSATGFTMRVGAAVVFTETSDIKYSGVAIHITPDDNVLIPADGNYKPCLQFKAKSTVAGPTQSPGTFVVGASYNITALGAASPIQDFTAIGASANAIGVKFTATGTGTAGYSGSAQMAIQNSIIGIHETFDWASNTAANLHVGIFVAPSEKWVNNLQWSETIAPSTMLYVDQKATDFAQYQYWSTAATGVAGTISGSILTLTGAVGSGLLKEMYITAPPTYASGPLYVNGSISLAGVTGSLAARTRCVGQLTATGATGSTSQPQNWVASPTVGATGAGSTTITVANGNGVAAGQIVMGSTGAIVAGTFVESVTQASVGATGVVLLSKPLNAAPSGAVSFYTPGGVGTYQLAVNGDQTSTANNGVTIGSYGAYYSFKPIESFFAPGNSAGRAALGDRIEKSFGLGPALNTAEDAKGVFIFGVKNLGAIGGATGSFFYTKYWREMR